MSALAIMRKRRPSLAAWAFLNTDFSRESKSSLMSDSLSIVIAEPSYRIRLTQSWPLLMDTAYTLTFYSLQCICRSDRHEENRRQV